MPEKPQKNTSTGINSLRTTPGGHDRKASLIPESLKNIYPNHVQSLYGTPACIFRDHRWTLPVLYRGWQEGMLSLPVLLITFDRHRDALEPVNGAAELARFRRDEGTFENLVELVTHHLSPRDDDWILSGMELGLISDAVQFRSAIEPVEGETTVQKYVDEQGTGHRLFRLGRPVRELSYKGALVDTTHEASMAGLWPLLGWDSSKSEITTGTHDRIVDIDLDFFTFSWDTHTFPFPLEIYEGEFLNPCHSGSGNSITPAAFLRRLIETAPMATVATEPDFCGGAGKTGIILRDVNRLLFDNTLDETGVQVDYPPVYPHE
ncbi:UPF0489 family protein [bacterium]|nr:UPF0489 family protein [bacterium]